MKYRHIIIFYRVHVNLDKDSRRHPVLYKKTSHVDILHVAKHRLYFFFRSFFINKVYKRKRENDLITVGALTFDNIEQKVSVEKLGNLHPIKQTIEKSLTFLLINLGKSREHEYHSTCL